MASHPTDPCESFQVSGPSNFPLADYDCEKKNTAQIDKTFTTIFLKDSPGFQNRILIVFDTYRPVLRKIYSELQKLRNRQ